MPLNQGVMDPIRIISPEGTYINPSGVVAISGSTIGCHRLIDVILRAFGAAACFQGCASATGFGEYCPFSLLLMSRTWWEGRLW